MWYFDPGNVAEGIHHLLFLVEELPFVGQVLPFAPSTYPEVFTKGLGSLVGEPVVFHHPGFHVPAFFSEYLEIGYIARNGLLHKDYHIIDPCDGFSLCANVFNGHLFKEG